MSRAVALWPAETALQRLVVEACSSDSPETQPVWTITPFIDATVNYAGGPYRFEWEMEWRHRGDLTFADGDVAFLIIPEELHGAARGVFVDAFNENTGPAYFCPFVDPAWSLERVREAFAS